MQWALLLLSSRPEFQDQLLSDIKDLPPEKIVQNSLLKGVWREALRLHPVAPFLTRYLQEDDTIGGYFVSKEVIYRIINFFVSSLDEAYYT